jgi:hypothetical protein
VPAASQPPKVETTGAGIDFEEVEDDEEEDEDDEEEVEVK